MNNQNGPENLTAVDMPEANSGVMGEKTIKAQKLDGNIRRSEKAKQMVKAEQKKSKMVIILVIAVIIVFFVIKMMPQINLSKYVGSKDPSSVNFKIDTGFDWADIYGTYIHSYYDDLKITRMDVSFADFNNDAKPEMLVRYEYKKDEYVVKVYQINNKEVTESKGFYNSQFKMIYSSITGQINWYIYINSSGKYGSYTLMSKILDGNARDSDIKATNESELTEFNKTYLPSEYKITYYEVKKEKYVDDFKTVAGRFAEYNAESKKEKQKLEDATANWIKEQQNASVNTSIKVKDFTLVFGNYSAEVTITELGMPKTIKRTITLRDGYLIVDGREVKYKAYSSFVSVADGTAFIVVDNNTFTYGNDGGVYKLEE